MKRWSGKDDNEILMSLQEKALSGDENARGKLWQHSLFCCKKIARFEFRKSGFVFDDDDIDDLAARVVCALIARFKKHPGYKARKNFFAMLYYAVRSYSAIKKRGDEILNDALKVLNSNRSFYVKNLAPQD